MKKTLLVLFTVMLILPLQIFSQEVIDSYFEDFNDPVDLDIWSPNKLQFDDTSLVFTVTQEENALKVIMKQLNFPDGQMYNFGITFDLNAIPHVALRLKLEMGATYNGEEIETIPFSMSPWNFSPDTVRQHSNITFDAPADGEWYDYLFDWSEDDEDQETYPNDYSNISRFLLETVRYPETHTATFWLDDFLVGKLPASSTDSELSNGFPIRYELSQNFPNPFNPTTTISYSIPQTAHVFLEIYTLNGQHVATLVNQTQTAGRHQLQYNAAELASGTYILHLKSAKFNAYKRMTLIK